MRFIIIGTEACCVRRPISRLKIPSKIFIISNPAYAYHGSPHTVDTIPAVIILSLGSFFSDKLIHIGCRHL